MTSAWSWTSDGHHSCIAAPLTREAPGSVRGFEWPRMFDEVVETVFRKQETHILSS